MPETDHENAKAAASDQLDALVSIDAVTSEDISEFADQIQPGYKEAFCTMPADRQLALVAMHKLSADQLFRLFIIERRGPITGLHRVANEISALFSWTGLPKYEELCRRIAAVKRADN